MVSRANRQKMLTGNVSQQFVDLEKLAGKYEIKIFSEPFEDEADAEQEAETELAQEAEAEADQEAETEVAQEAEAEADQEADGAVEPVEAPESQTGDGSEK